MKSKWRIDKYPEYVFGEDKKLYRLPYTKDNRYFDFREIKKQKGNRYYLYNRKEWLSEKSIKKRGLLRKCNSPIVIIREETETPW